MDEYQDIHNQARFQVSPESLKQDFVEEKVIASGHDGEVSLYAHKTIAKLYVAVKTPYSETRHEKQSKRLITEAKTIGKLHCKQIVSLVGFDPDFSPLGPALFLEYCSLGDCADYFKKLRSKYGYIPEETLWKFLADMSKGLAYLESHGKVPLIHGDLKPENILVAMPPGSKGKFTTMPDFKIGDFSRAVEYREDEPQFFKGTYEYGPLREEREEPLTPAVDVWGVGATLQSLALGVVPVQSEVVFRETWFKETGERISMMADLKSQHWRSKKTVVYRPLNASVSDHLYKWDWPAFHLNPPRYSDKLNRYYDLFWEKDAAKRPTAAYLVKYLVPVAERQMAVLREKRVAYVKNWVPK